MRNPVTLQDILDILPHPARKSGKAYITRCYNSDFHNNGDNKPSLAIYDDGYKCFACGEHGSLYWLKKQLTGEPEVDTKPIPKRKNSIVKSQYDLKAIWESLPFLPDQAKKILEEKHLDSEWLESLGWRWHTNQIKGWGEGIFIPYEFEDKFVWAKLRKLEGDVKFLGLPGVSAWPYRLDNIIAQWVYVAEGETDCLTLERLGFATVGIPGATSTGAIEKVIEEAEKHKSNLVVVPDNDKAGAEFEIRVRAAALQRVRVETFHPPFGKDVNEWYTKSKASDAHTTLMEHAMQDDLEPVEKNLFDDDWIPRDEDIKDED